eukprot:3198823-Pleurochrysis_carterae.AAC.3
MEARTFHGRPIPGVRATMRTLNARKLRSAAYHRAGNTLQARGEPVATKINDYGKEIPTALPEVEVEGHECLILLRLNNEETGRADVGIAGTVPFAEPTAAGGRGMRVSCRQKRVAHRAGRYRTYCNDTKKEGQWSYHHMDKRGT